MTISGRGRCATVIGVVGALVGTAGAQEQVPRVSWPRYLCFPLAILLPAGWAAARRVCIALLRGWRRRSLPRT